MATADDGNEIASLRRQRDAALATAVAAEDRKRAIEEEIARAERSGSRDTLGRLREALVSAGATAQRSRTAHAELRQSIAGRLDEWARQTPPGIVADMSDTAPFVLLPVRIETRFTRGPRGIELRVRIYPDDIAIGAPPDTPTDDERSAGEAYWRARAASAVTGAGAAERKRYEGAWNAIATRHGEYRASWVVRQTQPTNWDPSQSQPSPGADALTFPLPGDPVGAPVPRAEALPDCFAVVLIAGGNVVRTEYGRPVPDDLALGPDAAQADTWLQRDPVTGRLVAAESLKWLIDFDAAEQVGMALRIPLSAPFDTQGFDRLLVIGVRGAAAGDDGPKTLEALLAKHRYDRGCSIVRNGTPTNNTESARSGWQPASTEAAQLFTIEDAPPSIAPQPGVLGIADGWRLHRLLGLSEAFSRRLPNAAATDIAEAFAMNRAAIAGTLDDFVHEFLNGVVSPAAAAALHRFFIDRVSARGLYPALRVGRQPYGVVLTSAWSRWAPEKNPPGLERMGGYDIERALHTLIGAHRARWEGFARAAVHAAQPSDKPFDRLMRIVGLLASSVEFASRKAVSDAYVEQRLRFGGAAAAAISAWFSRLIAARTASFKAVGFPASISAKEPLLAAIAFLDHTDPWQAPIVDRDPRVPLSERDTIGPFDGTRNYLTWLATASRADLQSERFTGADGAGVGRPAALLYALLRHALLAALEQDVLGLARDKGLAYFDVITQDPLIANIGAAQHVLRKDYLDVDAARLGIAPRSKALADYVLEDLPAASAAVRGDAVRVAEAREALTVLAGLPTARLERLLAEHIDLCSYRLDAWVTALYGTRLERMLDAQPAGTPAPRHLGAFGWLENVRPVAPETRRTLEAEEIPLALRKVASKTVFEDTQNGGYVHAPSLAQAATAAVLRNGYLSHATHAEPTPFAVNLSSARMRAAIELTEGVRNGQPIAALLGYQLERGLHERHSGIELDSVIYVLRDAFPLVSGLLADAPVGTSVETVEARNVVHGLDLLEATAEGTYPWGIAGLPAVGTAAAVAVAAEIDRIRDGLDAVADLLLSESVHQAVQGNFARTKASLQALTDPEAPPEPEVLRTPRSGRTMAFRVTIALDPDGGAGAPGTTPRADANRPLDHWLAQHLPALNAIGWTVRNGTAAPVIVTAADVGLQPLDLVLMSGDRLGDRSSELERYIIRRFRFDAAVADDVTTTVAPEPATGDLAKTLSFDFGVAAAAGGGLASVHPLLIRLRGIVSRSRPAHALDAWLSTDTQRLDAADPTGSASGDPALVDFRDLADRVENAFNALTLAGTTLQTALGGIAALRTALETDPATVSDPAWAPALQVLRQALFGALPFGIAEALPADGLTVSRVLIDVLIGQGKAVAKLIADRRTRALALRSTTFPALPANEPELSRELARRRDIVRQNLMEAAREIFGPSYVIVPLYRFHAIQATEFASAAAAPATSDAFAIEAWLQSIARVRPRVADAVWAIAAARWRERPFADPRAIQLPHKAGAPWIGDAIGSSLPRGEWLSIVTLDGLPPATGLQAGLVIDDWTETVPEARETTGVSFHFNRPNAVAPQALLVVVPPVLRGNWEWDDLVGGVNEALDLAKLRAIEPDAVTASGHFQVLPAILSEFTAGRLAAVHWAARFADFKRTMGT
jgi:hypothetical protein